LNPSGKCLCGCGRTTKIAPRSNRRYGYVRGQHIDFVHGHHRRGHKHTPETRRKMSEWQLREKNKMWRGGRAAKTGYVLIKVGRDHPLADSKGYAKAHRLVMAEIIGRILKPGETVHHVDNDRRNNARRNLWLWPDQNSHKEWHDMLKCGFELRIKMPAIPLAGVVVAQTPTFVALNG
jgi:HNH endonuclease